MMRRRVRTLLMWRWAGRAGAARFDWAAESVAPAAVGAAEEAGLAAVRWLLEDMREARTVAVATAEAMRRDALALPVPAGDAPLGAPPAGEWLEEFAAAIEGDPELSDAPSIERAAARVSLPVDLMARWVARFGEEEALRLGASFAVPAPFDLRVNALRASRDEAAVLLAEEGIATTPTPLSPDGLRVAKKADVTRTKAFADGWIEVQDEGSQLVARAVGPHPGLRVLDACAGSGGKTLHLAALMGGQGEVVAHDRDARRLAKLPERAARAGATNVRVVVDGEAMAAAGAEAFDAVLLDAPCLGFGTLRRRPHLVWGTAPLAERLAAAVREQAAVLREYAPFVKPGGVLVYAVCSFEPEETGNVVAQFLSDFPEFAPDPIPGATESTRVLLPHRANTDGFFMARLRRRAS